LSIMLTIELLFDETHITILDTHGEYDDLKVYLDSEDSVLLRQTDEEHDTENCIFISYDQLRLLFTALELPEGCYISKE